jgi:cystathionine beta-lyase/cystathionine gamma-synthase
MAAITDVRQPIHLSTTFRRGAPSVSALPRDNDPYIYSRIGNPNRAKLKKELAKLEGGSLALDFSSGLAASISVFQLLTPGSRVLIPDQFSSRTNEVRGRTYVD